MTSKLHSNLINLNLNRKKKSISKRTAMQLFIIAGLLVFNIVLILVISSPAVDYDYTGSYTAKVYEDGKRVKSAESNYILVLNEDGSGSLVLNGDATNSRWTAKGKKMTIGDKSLTAKEGTLVYKDAEKNLKVVFSVGDDSGTTKVITQENEESSDIK